MKTLDEIKTEYANGMGYETWETFRDEFLNERTAYQIEPHFDIIAEKYRNTKPRKKHNKHFTPINGGTGI